MNINEQLEHLLANLGVEMEYAEHEQHDEYSVPDISIFQSSRDHYGVFYRLDIVAVSYTHLTLPTICSV